MATLAVASIIPALSAGLTTGETWSCTQYAQANTQSAICGDRPNAVCSQKCVGGVVVDGCSSASNASGPLTRQTCTISFSHISPTSSNCVNGQGSFMCSGVPTGQATCSGCVDSTLHLDPALSQTVPPLAAPAIGAPAPVVAASSSPAASTVAPPLAVKATAPSVSSAAPAAPAAPAPAVTAAPAISTQVVTVYSQPTTSTRTSAQDEDTPQSDSSSSNSNSTTSIASITYTNPATPFVVTLGLLAAGVTLL
ncbi:hypothetical protein VP01_930g11 [Puccinia sorghi]|uniref:Uncharacterized protein n=1 Tax=Puccinia sorghi TaxID=27349 RepID=A0A0L6U935_9BASI|nr:hypothetical protein VP01_930g11 [Puccinia sorghi]